MSKTVPLNPDALYTLTRLSTTPHSGPLSIETVTGSILNDSLTEGCFFNLWFDSTKVRRTSPVKSIDKVDEKLGIEFTTETGSKYLLTRI
jgi:hypothetical protein